jgi:hypothetical protein
MPAPTSRGIRGAIIAEIMGKVIDRKGVVKVYFIYTK